MARKKKHPEHVNHERWLISYADFITLLFAFFVVMFAVSRVDAKKVEHFSEAFSKAVNIDPFPGEARAGILAGGTAVQEAPELPETRGGLPAELEEVRGALAKAAADAKLHGLQIIVQGRSLVLRLPESIFYDSGEDALKPATLHVIDVIAPELAKRTVEVQVEGHTDSVPIRNARAHSNWELSSLRAAGVVSRLEARGVAGDRLGATGYGETRPIAPNATVEGRKQNRRVDVVIRAYRRTSEQDAGDEAADPAKPMAKLSGSQGHGADAGKPSPRGASVTGSTGEHEATPKPTETAAPDDGGAR